MAEIVCIAGVSDFVTRTSHDGKYIVSWNPHTEAGVLDVVSTDDKAKARRFRDKVEIFDEWKTVSQVQRIRPWDGQLNRPLTALNLDISHVEEG